MEEQPDHKITDLSLSSFPESWVMPHLECKAEKQKNTLSTFQTESDQQLFAKNSNKHWTVMSKNTTSNITSSPFGDF